MCLSEDSNGWVKGVFEIYLCHASGGENVRIDICVWWEESKRVPIILPLYLVQGCDCVCVCVFPLPPTQCSERVS